VVDEEQHQTLQPHQLAVVLVVAEHIIRVTEITVRRLVLLVKEILVVHK
jgi:hypothetical protein